VEDSAVADLWLQFDAAIEDASHVLVLGHGLADDHLVGRLGAASAPLGVTYFNEADEHAIEQLLPKAQSELTKRAAERRAVS